ncbi:MAG: transposase [Candidatus Altarchaeum sp. CG12_big_fil_rev_8_21_14_0_65_33_22]|uniref:Transposase n=2 Tax=Candidatus Altarchaeum hamiconexum TaxID=1803513 RepID=A0A8J8CEY8_9ARCH|nr:transposase [Candidatus Altarchaeum hamiconexum]PIN67905.1 MAG: transposase [Candidatus Altarchaeum sp. CG12_big_fil_rev_8_21_14_0_65_33_22]PIX48154.1 MAG: transposase [Candidatus Altarchaeum sp. CG_4_8_14_3_um_filter_33_2054]PIZ29445.1 MAG: transposase [Candidatus Altarchaeum sp. CG_4_10_14_0_8_um_filter_32_851]PJC14157.1 MAG: transposase [Candidatus Altarchaeum sp. CG_4_9_14_0_8_um_filter_32_206]
MKHGRNMENMAIISDDAGQFDVFVHGLCWIHAERNIQKVHCFTQEQTALLEGKLAEFWKLYKELKLYKDNATPFMKEELNNRFDQIFTEKTGFLSLDQTLEKIGKNKQELLLVLDRLDVPLHNNTSERDIREYVKKRKISGSTRSNNGQKCRDTFTSLKKTCRKLGIGFWEYLDDRINMTRKIPLLSDMVALTRKINSNS